MSESQPICPAQRTLRRAQLGGIPVGPALHRRPQEVRHIAYVLTALPFKYDVRSLHVPIHHLFSHLTLAIPPGVGLPQQFNMCCLLRPPSCYRELFYSWVNRNQLRRASFSQTPLEAHSSTCLLGTSIHILQDGRQKYVRPRPVTGNSMVHLESHSLQSLCHGLCSCA